MAKEIQELCKNLSLSDENEEDLLIENKWVEEAERAGKQYLICKLVIKKPQI